MQPHSIPPPPRLSAGEVRMQNALVGRRRALPLPLAGGGEWLLRLHPVTGKSTPFPSGVFLEGSAGGKPFRLSLPAPPPPPLVALGLGVDPEHSDESWLTHLPPDSRAVLLEAAAEGLVGQLGKGLPAGMSVGRVEFSPAQDRDESGPPGFRQLAFTLEDGAGGWSLSGVLAAGDATMQSLAAWADRIPVEPPAPGDDGFAGGIPCAVRVLVGHSSLSVKEFRQLSTADIILLSEDFQSRAGRCKVGLGLSPRHGFHASFQVREDRLAFTLLEPMPEPAPNPRREPPSSPRATAPSAATSPPLDDLPVELVFEAGSTQIPFGELRTLQPGFTFTLEGATLERPILIRANGRVVGEGELVQVGERLGVRIVAFRAAGE